jgi:hypothetical protein
MQGCRGIRQPYVDTRMSESDSACSMRHLCEISRSRIGRRGVKAFIAAEAHQYSLSQRSSGRRSPSVKCAYFQTCFVSHEYLSHAASSSSSSGGATGPPCCAIIKAVNSAILALKSFT